MKIQGTVVAHIDVVRGETERGTWCRGGIVISYGHEVRRNVAVTAFGEDKVKFCQDLPLGIMVEVDYSLESREFNGKYYTDVRLIRAKSFAMQGDSRAVQYSVEDLDENNDMF